MPMGYHHYCIVFYPLTSSGNNHTISKNIPNKVAHEGNRFEIPPGQKAPGLPGKHPMRQVSVPHPAERAEATSERNIGLETVVCGTVYINDQSITGQR